MSNKITKEQMLKARSIGDAYAQSVGKENLDALINPIREGLNSSDGVQVDISRELARGAVSGLTKLILRQEIFTSPDAPYMKWVDVFYDGEVKEGNAKLYDFNNPTGADTYNANEFVPTALNVQDVDEFTIKMYQDAETLSTQGYQFRKPLVYIESKWIPYFKAGNLTGFIAMLQANIEATWRKYIFDKIVRKITGQTYKKTINGTAANAFDAWSQEILPEIRKMTTLSSDYNVNNANTNLMSTSPSDLIILAHPKTIQTLQSGIKSQLFNAQFLDLKGLVDAENFIDCGRQLTIGNPDTKISVGNDYYVDENTIYVISKKAMKHFSQIDTIGTQYFPRNLAIQFTYHKWGALDFLPWGQAFKYTNRNLNVLP